MTSYTRQFCALLAAMLIVAACAGDDAAPPSELSTWRIERSAAGLEECPRPSGRARARAVVRPPAEYCDIVAVPVVTLLPSSDGSRPDPGEDVVMTTDGRYFTTGHRQVLEWARDGSYVRAVGKDGGGPGEFAGKGGVMLFLDANDSLFVLDGEQRWTVFSPTLQYVRTFVGRYNNRHHSAMQVVSGYGIVSGGGRTFGLAEATSSLHLMNFDGSPNHSFGPVRSGSADSDRDDDRMSAFDGRDAFWVTRPNGHREPITLQRWTKDRRLAQELELRVPWFPEGGYDNTSRPIMPEYDVLHVDGSGLVWMCVLVRDKRWQQLQGEERRKREHEIADWRCEVIDPASGVAPVSYRLDGPFEEEPPFARLFPRTRRSYRSVRDSLGLRSIQIYDIYLVARR